MNKFEEILEKGTGNIVVKSRDSKLEIIRLNLHQKLIEIRKQVEYIQKDSKGYNFVYASESALLGRIREEMDNQGVLLETDMVGIRDIQIQSIEKDDSFVSTNKGVEVHLQFSWVNAENPEERITKNMFMRAPDGEPQSLGKIISYSHRYFLYKNLSVPTDKDDPDSFDKKMGNIEYLSQAQQDYIKNLVGNDQTIRERVLAAASRTQGAKVTQYSEIVEDSYDFLIKNILKLKKDAEEKKDEKNA